MTGSSTTFHDPVDPAARSRRWVLRLAVGVTAVAAVAHLASSPGVVAAYTDSDLEELAKVEAVILWFLSTVTFASIPTALAWSTRVPPAVARPLQAYAGVLVGGLGAVSLPVALVAHGPSGVVKVPQVLAGAAAAALIFAGRAPGRANRSTDRLLIGR